MASGSAQLGSDFVNDDELAVRSALAPQHTRLGCTVRSYQPL